MANHAALNPKASDKANPAAPGEANPGATDKTFSDAAVVHRALQVAAFPESWKSYLRERLPKVNA